MNFKWSKNAPNVPVSFTESTSINTGRNMFHCLANRHLPLRKWLLIHPMSIRTIYICSSIRKMHILEFQIGITKHSARYLCREWLLKSVKPFYLSISTASPTASMWLFRTCIPVLNLLISITSICFNISARYF